MKKDDMKEKTTKKGKDTKESNVKKSSGTKKGVSKTTEQHDSNKKITKKVVVEEVKEVEENTSKDETIIKEEKNNKKKGDILLILGLVVVVVLGFLVMRDKNAGPSYELPLTLSGDAGLQQLTYEEYQTKIDNDESFVVILERATCSHCISYIPVAEQFASDNELPMYYIDTDTFTSDDWDDFERSISYLRRANGNWGTPTTVVQAGYDTVSYIEGETTAEELIELYNEYFDMGE